MRSYGAEMAKNESLLRVHPIDCAQNLVADLTLILLGIVGNRSYFLLNSLQIWEGDWNGIVLINKT